MKTRGADREHPRPKCGELAPESTNHTLGNNKTFLVYFQPKWCARGCPGFHSLHHLKEVIEDLFVRVVWHHRTLWMRGREDPTSAHATKVPLLPKWMCCQAQDSTVPNNKDSPAVAVAECPASSVQS